jgi:hypothetical protein
MRRLIVTSGFLLAVSGCEQQSNPVQSKKNGAGETEKGAEITYRYLVVDVVGPQAWGTENKFSIDWEGRTVEFPIVLRITTPLTSLDVGAGPQVRRCLEFGKKRVLVVAQPPTEFQVRNILGASIIQERPLATGKVVVSIVTGVAISPPDYESDVAPNGQEGDVLQSGKNVEKRMRDLVAAGRIVDIRCEEAEPK